jgi:site-specific DNA-methyltransferase (adenine-specific)
MEKNIIYHGDCIDGMKILPDNSVDMVLTDPPYGTTRNKWDTVADMDAFWKEIKRVAKKNSAILIFTQMPFTATAVISNSKMFRYEWICEKARATGFLNAKRMPMKCHENVLVFYDKLPVYNPQFEQGKPYKAEVGRYSSSNYGNQTPGVVDNASGKRFPRDVLKVNWRQNTAHTLHPTQKPVSLCEYFIKTYTNEQAVVLDPFMGSGTTAVAAKNTNRNYIGWEQDNEYFEVIKKRLNG